MRYYCVMKKDKDGHLEPWERNPTLYSNPSVARGIATKRSWDPKKVYQAVEVTISHVNWDD